MNRTRATGLRVVLIGLFVPGAVVSASAQVTDSSLARIRGKIAQGDEVKVIDDRLGVSEGTLQGLSNSSLLVQEARGTRQIPVDEITEIRRRGDLPWNGLLIGAGVGAVIGFSTFTQCQPIPPAQTCADNLTSNRGLETVVAAGLFGTLGLAVDAFINGWTTVYRAPGTSGPTKPTRATIRVQAAPHAIGGHVTLRF